MATKSREERLAILDSKIEKKQAELERLELQKEKLLHPINMRTVLSKAKEAGWTAEQIAETLGLEF